MAPGSVLAQGSAANNPDNQLAAALIDAVRNDQHYAFRSRDGFHIGLVCMNADSTGKQVIEQVAEGIQHTLKRQPAEQEWQLDIIQAQTPQEVWERADQNNLDALFLGPGVDSLLRPVLSFASYRHVLILTAMLKYVQAGAAVGVIQRNGQVHVLIHPEAALAQGARFGEDYLARVDLFSTPAQYQSIEVFKKRKVSGDDPVYPAMARTARREAKLVVKISVNCEGDVIDVNFMKSDPLFEAEVRRAIGTWKFKPYLFNDRPLATYSVYTFDFRME